jgi:hypothetical protein
MSYASRKRTVFLVIGLIAFNIAEVKVRDVEDLRKIKRLIKRRPPSRWQRLKAFFRLGRKPPKKRK